MFEWVYFFRQKRKFLLPNVVLVNWLMETVTIEFNIQFLYHWWLFSHSSLINYIILDRLNHVDHLFTICNIYYKYKLSLEYDKNSWFIYLLTSQSVSLRLEKLQKVTYPHDWCQGQERYKTICLVFFIVCLHWI